MRAVLLFVPVLAALTVSSIWQPWVWKPYHKACDTPVRRRVGHKSVALMSYAGSGNTWTRHIIEALTGLTTASIYCDPSLTHVFKAECDGPELWNRSVVVKTHKFTCEWDRVVVLLRHPMHALIAHYNYWHYWRGGHTENEHVGVIPAEEWSWPEWHAFVLGHCRAWTNRTAAVLGDPITGAGGCGKSRIASVLFYEEMRLQSRALNPAFVDALEEVLGVRTRRHCVLRDATGRFRRPSLPHYHPAKRALKDPETQRRLKAGGCIHAYEGYRQAYRPLG